MPLAQLPLDCEVHVIADWFEFYVLMSEFSSASFRDIQRMWDRRRNAENSAPDGRKEEFFGHDGDEQFLETILQEIRNRIEYLGEAYPFEFNASEEGLLVKEELKVGHTVYLFCLLLSNVNNAAIFELDQFSYELDNFVRDLFQACSTWAAAAVLSGSACSFGFPRPDGSNFLNKLREVYALFGEGEVRAAPLPGVSSSPKDEGIDVIAWGHRTDAAPGRFYVLGQVATGGNWPGKSVVEYIRPFHENWFSEIPPSPPTAALFIPHCVPLTGEATLKQQVSILTRRYGQVYYRYVIPKLADSGHALACNDEKLSIERADDIEHIRTWVADTLDKMRESAAA
ncbi:hypothetical protein [Paraburkholderia caffeinilytica]|uniref:hypothetical protein n=1 Tax=Paraburkholderia caffeinilytica TaxID=1761016 RepID=UPI003DA0A6E2